MALNALNKAAPLIKSPMPRRPLLHRLRQTVLAAAVLAVLGWGYARASQPVTLVINQRSFSVFTHYSKIETMLRELGITLAPEDVVSPPLNATLAPGQTVSVQLARPVTVEADGQIWQLLTHAATVANLLAALGLTPHPRDEIFLNGSRVTPAAALPQLPVAPAGSGYRQLLAALTPGGAVAATRPEAARLVIRRAVPVTLHTNAAASTFFTARPTVGEALLEQGLTLYLGDKVTPGLGAPLTAGMNIYIDPASPVTIKVDGRVIKTRTLDKTVGGALAQENIALMGQDYAIPASGQPLAANSVIQVVRVQEALDITEEFIPFETQWIADNTMELDQRDIRQAGQTGVIKTRHRVRFENGQEVARRFEDKWLAQAANTQIIAYGTKIVIRTLDTPDGPIEYWRRIPMRATAYSAATSGKPADHPRYGYTSSGLLAGLGVVAVDPRVIPLMTNLYVEKYGPAVAGDTGGQVLGRHIDLGYPDNQPLPVIFEWRNVYVLTPVPPADQIRYVLPNWPQKE